MHSVFRAVRPVEAYLRLHAGIATAAAWRLFREGSNVLRTAWRKRRSPVANLELVSGSVSAQGEGAAPPNGLVG
jgi:hypothetical protein